MEHLNDMYLFAKVIEHGGYSAAGRALGMATSKLSRHVADLESHLGVRLLNRTTRKICITDIGRTYYRHCTALVAEAQAATEAVARDCALPQGLLRVSCPGDLLRSHVAQIVSRYLREHPGVRLQVEATNRRVDVVAEGFDVALRVRFPPLEDSGLACRPLAGSAQTLVASPGFLQRHRAPEKPADLGHLPTVTNGRSGDSHCWIFQGKDGDRLAVSLTPRLASDDLATLRQAALDGIGIAYLPTFLVREELRSGALVQVLPALTLPSGVIHAVFPSRRGMMPAVRAFIDALVHGFDASESAT